MDPTALYYALSTLAQCAAALAALIGFLGLWRLDRLRDEDTQLENTLRGFLSQITSEAPARLTRAVVLDRCRRIVAEPNPGAEEQFRPQIAPRLTRLNALPGEQQQLTSTLSRFLRRTLMILALAIIGFVFADALYAWVLTRWIIWLLIILASISLYRHTVSVVQEAASSLRTLVIFVLLFAIGTPVIAGSMRCTTYEEKALGRLQTVCDDGTRGISTWNRTGALSDNRSPPRIFSSRVSFG